MRRSLLALPAAAALFGAGYLAGQTHQAQPATAAPAAQFGPQYCSYRTRTEYMPGLNAGSYTVLTAVVAEWSNLSHRWSSVSDYTAQSAINYSCERDY